MNVCIMSVYQGKNRKMMPNNLTILQGTVTADRTERAAAETMNMLFSDTRSDATKNAYAHDLKAFFA